MPLVDYLALMLQRKDFLQLLLSENKIDGKPKLTDDDIYASCITFLLAGYETTSNALAYTTYLLALHPEIQERLYQEVKDVIKGKEVQSIYVLRLSPQLHLGIRFPKD